MTIIFSVVYLAIFEAISCCEMLWIYYRCRIQKYSCFDKNVLGSQIENANLSVKVFVSYDVTSLFTNIPLQKTFDIAINLIFNHNPNLNITKKELKKLFVFVTSQTHYEFF